MASCCLARVVCSDVKHNFLLHYISAAAVVMLTPAFFSVYELNSFQAAQPLEVIIALIGVIMITPVFMPEQNENIRDVVRSKKTPYLLVCLLRLVVSAVIMTGLIALFVIYMKHSHSDVSFRHFSGTVASAMALGAIGFFAAGVSNNIIIGYMASLFYYIVNFSLKDKLGVFYIFSMMNGSFEEKKWLFGLAFTLIAAAFGFKADIRRRLIG